MERQLPEIKNAFVQEGYGDSVSRRTANLITYFFRQAQPDAAIFCRHFLLQLADFVNSEEVDISKVLEPGILSVSAIVAQLFPAAEIH